MELAEVERALRRSDEYFFEDGLWELACGLWLGLTLAVPAFVGGAAANWSPVLMLLAGLALRPAVLAAKRRWVYPHSGGVTYPDRPEPALLGLSSVSASAATAPSARRRVLLVSLAGVVFAALVALALEVGRRFRLGNAGGHVALGLLFGGSLLFAALRWRQRRWGVLALVVVGVSLLVPLSGLAAERSLAVHAAALAAAFVASGTLAFVAYRRRTARFDSDDDADGR